MRSIAVAVAAVVVLACSPSPSPSPSTPASLPATAAAALPTPTATAGPTVPPTATLEPVLARDDLPEVAFDPATTTTVCDPQVTQGLDGSVDIEEPIDCTEGLEMGLAAIRTVTDAPVERMYLSRPPCAAIACAAEAARSAIVSAWTGDGELHVDIAATNGAMAVTVPAPGAVVPWPQATATGPGVRRPVIEGAPRALADREPYPFCGHSNVLDAPNPQVAACFVDAVAAGRPAERLSIAYGTEGGKVTVVDRFAGRGAVSEYVGFDGGWRRADGGLNLNPGGRDYSFAQWPAGFNDVSDRPARSRTTEGWGRIRASPPDWWTVPAGAQVIPDDGYTLLYVVRAGPSDAMDDVARTLAAHGLAAIARDESGGQVSATFDDGTGACSASVVTRGTSLGSRVEVRYPVGCPR